MNYSPRPQGPMNNPDPLGIVRTQAGNKDSILSSYHKGVSEKLRLKYVFKLPIIAFCAFILADLLRAEGQGINVVFGMVVIFLLFVAGGISDIVINRKLKKRIRSLKKFE